VKLNTKIALSFIFIIVLVSGSIAFFAIQHETATLKKELKNQGLILAKTLADESYEAFLTDKFIHIMDYIETISKREYVVYAMIRENNGKVRAHSEMNKIGKLVKDYALSIINQGKPYIGISKLSNGNDIYELAIPVIIREKVVGVAQIGYSLKSLKASTTEVRNQIITITICCIFIGILASFLLSQRLTGPIAKLKKAANEIAKNNFGIKLDIQSRDEIGELSSAFNQMVVNLRASRHKLIKSINYTDSIIKSMIDALIVIDKEGLISTVNKATLDLLGYTQKELIGWPIHKIFTEETTIEKTGLKKMMTDGKLYNYETCCRARDGTEIPMLLNSSVMKDKKNNLICIVCTGKDIRDRKLVEEELLKAQKIESVSILAGGIAHDFNNILTGILGNISLAKIYINSEDKVFKRLEDAEKACLRAQNLTKQLLTFSRGGAPVKKITSISEFLVDSSEFLLRGSNSRCEFKIQDNLWQVKIDEGQISQVINNLIINADQAMPKGGIIKVTAENYIANSAHNLSIKEGKYVKISIEDEGIGIPKERLQKIFDPYFTTKQKGNGLGLTIVYSIIKNHDGFVFVESEQGIGTKFFIYLHAHDGKHGFEEKKTGKVLKGSGKVLLMDDEDVVLEVVGEMLKTIGYDVEFAKDGSKVIETYKKAKDFGEPFDIVIMDLTIPGGMGGKEAIQKLIEIDPEIKAIVSSGYSTDPVMAEYKKYGFCDVVAKPYTIEKLSSSLHRSLN
jgi:PAS domain S-box-containing protein